MFVVLVQFIVKAGNEQAFLERVCRQAADSLQLESDCRQFDVCRDDRNPRRILLYELYTNAAAFDAHLHSSHFVAFDHDVRPWVEHKSVEHWSRCEGSLATSGDDRAASASHRDN